MEQTTMTSGSGSPPQEPYTAADAPAKKGPLWLWIILGIVAVIVIIVVVLLLTGGSNVAVPDLKGLTTADATTKLTGASLSVGKTSLRAEAGATDGTVLESVPAAGTKVAKDSAVDLVIAGSETVKVPNLSGMQEAQAGAELQKVGLVVGTVTRNANDTIPAGQVAAQAPAAGADAAKGSTVGITVSTGKTNVVVPDLSGRTKEQATRSLETAKLTGEFIESFSSTVPADQVIGQAPPAGSQMPAGSVVTVSISKGKTPPPAATKVPDAVGKTEADGTALITGAGLKAQTTTGYSDTVAKGTIVSQNPTAGTIAAPGSTVTVTVSQGAAPPTAVKIPDVAGMNQADAQAALEKAGFKAQFVEINSDTVPAGQIIGQAPTAGTSSAPGVTVYAALSLGPAQSATVEVPDLSGMTLATAALQALDLKIKALEAFTEKAPKGEVFGQMPTVGTGVPPQSTVYVGISKGPAPTPTPY
jgi:beta-lactam-binding protein with PASTA domain